MGLRKISGKDLDYQFIQPVGHGAFAKVAKVKRVRDGKIMACKSIKYSERPERQRLAAQEIKAWASLGTEKYIASYSYDASWNPSTKIIHIYMDFYEGGTLQEVIDICRREKRTCHPVMAIYWAIEIARGIKACHDQGIIHRDIKPENILLSMRYVYNDLLWTASSEDPSALGAKDKPLASKKFLEWMIHRVPWCHLTDFGLARFSTGARLSHQTTDNYGAVGTTGYIASESLGDSPVFSSKSDVYSFGCLLYTLFTGRWMPSFTCTDAASSPVQDPYPQKLQHILMRCLENNPYRRLSSREALNNLREVYMDVLTSPFWCRTRWALEYSTEGGANQDRFDPSINKGSTKPYENGTHILPTDVPQILSGHSSSITVITFSPNGKLLATLSSDGDARLWNPKSGAELATLEGHSDRINYIEFSPDPDSNLLASCSADGTIRLWNSSQLRAAPRILEGYPEGVRLIKFSPDGRILASSDWKDQLKLWSVRFGTIIKTLRVDSNYIRAMAFSPDSTQLATITGDETLRLWGSRSGTVLGTYYNCATASLAYSPDGKLLATARESTVWVRDARSGSVIRKGNSPSGTVTSLAFSPDSKTLTGGSTLGSAFLWSMGSGIFTALKGHQGLMDPVVFSPSGRILASGSIDETVKIWDSQSGKCWKTLRGHSDYVECLRFSPYGRILASGSNDGIIMLWQLP